MGLQLLPQEQCMRFQPSFEGAGVVVCQLEEDEDGQVQLNDEEPEELKVVAAPA